MSSDGTSTAEGGISGLQSTEAMSVPNTSMVGFGVGNVPPNNSICYSSSFVSSINASGANFHQQAAQVGGGGGPHSISGEKLSDQLIQIVLYQQFEAPPSTLGGDTASAREAFNELDFNKTDRIAYRHLAHLIKEEDTDLLRSLLSDTQGSVDFAEFIQFVENVALKLRARAAGTSVSEE